MDGISSMLGKTKKVVKIFSQNSVETGTWKTYLWVEGLSVRIIKKTLFEM
jgi:hypothetical protein